MGTPSDDGSIPVVRGTLVNDEIWNIPGGIIYNAEDFTLQVDGHGGDFVNCESSPWGGDDKNTEKLERFLETWNVQITKVGNFKLTFTPPPLDKTLPDPMKEMYQLLGFVLNKYDPDLVKKFRNTCYVISPEPKAETYKADPKIWLRRRKQLKNIFGDLKTVAAIARKVLSNFPVNSTENPDVLNWINSQYPNAIYILNEIVKYYVLVDSKKLHDYLAVLYPGTIGQAMKDVGAWTGKTFGSHCLPSTTIVY